MKFEGVTIKDIAKALGLSVSTVSRALRGSYQISEERRQQVLAYAQKHHYRPNPAALQLKEQKTKAIGIVLSEIANHFFAQVLSGVESVARAKGYQVIISQSYESFEREKANVEDMVWRGVDGLLISLSAHSKDIGYLQRLRDRGLPIVFFDRVPQESGFHKVTSNNYQGAEAATNYLISKKYKRIGHITSDPSLSITRERLYGYRASLEKHQLPYQEQLVQYCTHGGMLAEEVEEAIRHLFRQKIKPDALFTASDRLTLTSLGILKRMFPKKMPPVVGFTNTPVTHLFSPPLTAVRQSAFEMGEQTMQLLIKIIESKRPTLMPLQIMLDTNLWIP